MIRTIQELFKIAATVVIGSLILVNCEPDADQLGSQFFQDGAQGTEKTYPIVAYNVNNGDSIRTDAARLQSATLGVFTESQFGMQKVSYVTQVRLPAANPDFGTNPKLDSAVLVIKPQYAIDSVTSVTKDDYIFPEGAIPAKRIMNTYPILKYGNTKIGGKTLLNFRVQEVTDFLGSNADQIRSNRNVAAGAQLGTKTFDGNVSYVKVTKDADDSVLLENQAGIRIKLDSTFFANKIINKPSTSPEFSDAASFIRYFKGIRISVDETDGYIFNFDPTSMELNLYYKSDKVTNGVTAREQSTYMMNVGGSNSHFNQIEFNRVGTPSAAALAAITPMDSINGAPKIFAQGMGGPGFGLKIPDATIAAVRNQFQNDKIGIVSAKLRIYTDAVSWNKKYAKPASFTVKKYIKKEKENDPYLNTFLDDMNALYGTGIYNLVKAFDLEKNPAYYDIGITQTFKNIIEKQNPKTGNLILNVGTYTMDASGNMLGELYPNLGPQNFNTRSFTPNRVVLVGKDPLYPLNDPSDPLKELRPKLILTYGQKQ
ncbi:MAG: DUF4270 domain-containing protein [Flavobacteriales bacterium]|nr:DUF4270 domain-containing protein [Flavobacteriales bacterium]